MGVVEDVMGVVDDVLGVMTCCKSDLGHVGVWPCNPNPIALLP